MPDDETGSHYKRYRGPMMGIRLVLRLPEGVIQELLLALSEDQMTEEFQDLFCWLLEVTLDELARVKGRANRDATPTSG